MKIIQLNPRFVFLALLLSALSFSLNAEVKLPKVIGSNMVLQRNQPITIWGWADKGEKILVRFSGQETQVLTGPDGLWMVSLDPMEAGGPFEMVISGSNTITLENIMIGDVWICSGQSNMEWTVSNSNNPEEEIAAAIYPNIRLFEVPHNVQLSPVEDIPSGEWMECSPENISSFTAVGYFFGRHIHQEVGVPIGLISTNWGGTNVETWMSAEMSAQDPEMKAAVEEIADMDLEGMQKKMQQDRKELLESLGALESGMVDGEAIWAKEELDLSDWKTMELPGLWESQGLAGVDGVIWFRRTLSLTDEQIAGLARLELGAIDDNDRTWINGVEVGNTQAYNKKRVYEIKEGLLKAGENILAVRVEDTGGGGGFWGDPEDMRLSTSGGAVGLHGPWSYRVSSESFKINSNSTINPNSLPTLLYNGMIHPLLNYAVMGAIWYQGEANASRAYTYRTRFPNLIRDWRNKWDNQDMGFYFVQLANFKQVQEEPRESDWAELREAQAMTLSLPKTGMAVIIDIGEADDIHPRNKQDVGNRLALAALHDTYKKDLVYSGPVYKSMQVDGSKLILEFDPMGSDMVAKDKYGYVKGFAVAGEDRVFHWARGIVKDNLIILHSTKVEKPVAVRYAWGDNPDDANLHNKAGLPASPFRTDEWPGITYEK